MSLKERTINVDIMTKEYTKLKYKQGDSNQILKFKFYKNGSELDLTGYVAGIFYEKPNNEILEKTGTISTNTVTTTITSGVLNTAGVVKTEIFLTKDTEVAISFTILIEVESSIDKNAAVQEKEEWDIIKDLLTGTGGTSISIDDTTTATNKTWSSDKINSQIKELAIKIDNIGESGGSSGGSSGDTTTSDYDTEISLPFTASGGNVDVKVVFSKGDEISNPSYTNEVTGNTPNDFEVLKYGSPTGYTLENTTVDGINCLKFQYTGGVHYYRLYSKANTEKTYGSDKWFLYMKIKLGGDANTNYLPETLNHISYNLNSISGFDGIQLGSQLNKTSTDWQVLSVAGQVNQIDAYMNKNPQIGFLQITGTVYIAKMCLVNLTTQGLESKTKAELFAMVENGEFDNNSSSATTTEFSCTVTNGSTTEDITPFTDTGVTKYYTVSNGSTLSIAQRTGYGMPSIQALIKSKSTSTVEIEDCELKLNTRFKGKKVIFEGDSITDYDYLEGYNNKSWANYLTTILGMNLVSNGAVGGSLLTHSNEAVGFSVQQRIANTNYDSNAKLFLIHAGTNDWGQAKTLGNIDSTDISTICGALNNIIDKIQTNCPKATIVIISPIHRQSDSGGFYNNSAGYSLYDIAVAYQKVCSRWGAKFINGLELGLNSLNENNLATNFIDGLHPTPAGHKIMAVEIARKIATF